MQSAETEKGGNERERNERRSATLIMYRSKIDSNRRKKEHEKVAKTQSEDEKEISIVRLN